MSRRTQSVSYKCARRRAKRIAAGLPVKPRKAVPKKIDPSGAAKWAAVFRERIE